MTVVNFGARELWFGANESPDIGNLEFAKVWSSESTIVSTRTHRMSILERTIFGLEHTKSLHISNFERMKIWT